MLMTVVFATCTTLVAVVLAVCGVVAFEFVCEKFGVSF
jgi:hypothetical protein